MYESFMRALTHRKLERPTPVNGYFAITMNAFSSVLTRCSVEREPSSRGPAFTSVVARGLMLRRRSRWASVSTNEKARTAMARPAIAEPIFHRRGICPLRSMRNAINPRPMNPLREADKRTSGMLTAAHAKNRNFQRRGLTMFAR